MKTNLPRSSFCVLLIIAGATASDIPYDQLNSCDNACDPHEFCGRDNVCYPLGCETFWKMADANLTGNVDGTSDGLTCFSTTEDREFLSGYVFCHGGEMPLAVHALPEGGSACSCPGCVRSQIGDRPLVTMNRKCTAIPQPDRAFQCYDIAPDTDLDEYFAEYEEASNSTLLGFNHTYQVSVAYTSLESNTSTIYFVFDGLQLPVFNKSLATMTMHSTLFPIRDSEFRNCGQGCLEDEFCGRDNVCYPWNCDNFFSYGPTSYTGHDGSPFEELACSDTITVEDGVDEDGWPIAVGYRCHRDGIIISTGEDPPEDRSLTFNRHCKGQPVEGQTFTCFDIAPTTDVQDYFADYLNATASSECRDVDKVSLSDDLDANLTWTGYHEYATCLKRVGYTNCAVYSGFVETLDPENARYVISTSLSGGPPTSAPTSSSNRLYANQILFSILLLLWSNAQT